MDTDEVCVNNCSQNNRRRKVNTTSNRLVKESCGHTKCMKCLFKETSGCVACLKENKNAQQLKVQDVDEDDTPVVASDDSEISAVVPRIPPVNVDKESAIPEGTAKKKRPVITHIAIETDGTGRWYFCQVCKKKFHTRSMVAYHAYCNGQPKPYQCQECNTGFRTLSHYKYHVHVHRQERRHTCELCGAGFYAKSKLQRHKLKHTQERPYHCPQCAATFTSRSALRRHALRHSGTRPFTCGECARAFRDHSNYRKHMRRHDISKGKSRPQLKYQCQKCTHSFDTNKDLRRHNATHSDAKPFRCLICDRQFQRKDNLERHIRNTHCDVDVPSAVVIDGRPPQPPPASNGHHAPEIPDDLEDDAVKARLEELNPLPPMTLCREDIEQSSLEDLNPTPIDVSKIKSDTKLFLAPEYKNPLPQIEVEKNTELELLQQVETQNNFPEESQTYTEPTQVIPTYASHDKAELLFLKPEDGTSTPIGWHIVNIYPGPEMPLLQPVTPTAIEVLPTMSERTVISIEEPTDDEKANIIQANNARESVIFGPVKKSEDHAKDNEYVHKLKIANSFISKELPPIDPNKFRRITSSTSSLDIGPVPPVNLHVYKKILYPDTDEQKQEMCGESEKKMHWRVKMKSQITKQKDVKDEMYE